MPRPAKPPEETKQEFVSEDFVSANDFQAFKEETTATQNKMLDILERMSTPPAKDDVKNKAPQYPADDPMRDVLMPQYQTVFEKYFDPEDGFTARLNFPEIDDKGNETGGITFTIFVPMKFSNTDDGYRSLYKQDLRTRALQPHAIAKGIDEWCKKVAQNLKYDKNIKTK